MLRDSADYTGRWPEYQHDYGDDGVLLSDINGDGLKDLLIGTNFPFANQQYIDVHLGNRQFHFDAARPDQRLDSRAMTDLHPNWYPLMKFRILDMNNDGTDDLVIMDDAVLKIYYGNAGLFPQAPDRVISSPDPSRIEFNDDVFPIGDINADGFDDYAIGLYVDKWAAIDIYLGGKNGISDMPVARIMHPDDWSVFGHMSIIGLGDIDGDGVGDFGANGWYGSNFFHWNIIRIMSGDTSYLLDAPRYKNDTPPSIHTYPNPFHVISAISFVLEKKQNSSVMIYDLLSRQVKHVHEEQLFKGEHTVIWDGTDDDGVAVPAGVYYCVIRTESRQIMRCIVKY